MKKVATVILAIILLSVLLGSCTASSNSNSSGYSSTYQNDAGYREDVREIADVFGVSEYEVDSKINAVTGEK